MPYAARPPGPRWRRALLPALLCALLGLGASAPDPAPALPPAVAAALAEARLGAASSAFAVTPLDGGGVQLAVRTDVPMNPASTMKLVTTYAALSLLGPDYRWKTQVLAHRRPVHGRLDGDLIVRGAGDPSLVVERLWLLVRRLRGVGVREIHGDLVIDRSAYAPDPEAAASLDGNERRPYNVAPDALLINFKALSLDFLPDAAEGIAHVIATPTLDGVEVPATVALAEGGCGDWKERLGADFSHPRAITLRGRFPRACGAKTWNLSVLAPDAYALAVFRALWREAGGRFTGGVRAAPADGAAIVLAEIESPPLAEIVRDINKNSNNVMARQLFLEIGRSDGDPAAPAASVERSIRALRAWLALAALDMPELVVVNGSGLSRQERISAGHLSALLAHAWRSAEMPDFAASLPLAGIDGTMKHRQAATGSAWVKTGSLADVRALGGYVFAASGHRYAVVAMTNDPRAAEAQPAHDALLQWVWENG